MKKIYPVLLVTLLWLFSISTYSVGLEHIDMQNVSQDSIVVFPDELPEFPGGEMALRNYMTQNIRYPKEAQENGLQGKIYVNFVIGKDGIVRGAQSIRFSSKILAKEAVRLINSMPRWKPGVKYGKTVPVSFTLPVNFVLNPAPKILEISNLDFINVLRKRWDDEILQANVLTFPRDEVSITNLRTKTVVHTNSSGAFEIAANRKDSILVQQPGHVGNLLVNLGYFDIVEKEIGVELKINLREFGDSDFRSVSYLIAEKVSIEQCAFAIKINKDFYELEKEDFLSFVPNGDTQIGLLEKEKKFRKISDKENIKAIFYFER